MKTQNVVKTLTVIFPDGQKKKFKREQVEVAVFTLESYRKERTEFNLDEYCKLVEQLYSLKPKFKTNPKRRYSLDIINFFGGLTLEEFDARTTIDCELEFKNYY